MATLENLRPRERIENSWYDLIAGQLQVLIPKFGLATHPCSCIGRMN